MTDQDQLDAPKDPQTAAGLALARQSLSKPVTIDQILAIEDEAQEIAVRERDELRAALEPFASAFDRDRMPGTARRDYQRASAALHSKDGAS